MRPFATRKLWFWIFLLVVFLAGAGAGALASQRFLFGRPVDPTAPPPSPAKVADRISRELALSTEQRAQVEAVLERNRGRLEAFRTETVARFETLRKQIDEEIDAILTSEQRAKWQERRKRLDRFPPPGLPGPMPSPPR